MTAPKGLKDSFADFFENPSRESLRGLLQGHFGETRTLDFKKQWPEMPDVAKQCLGMANTGGGCLIMGVEEKPDKTLEPVGLAEMNDKADVTNGLQKYLPTDLLSQIRVFDFQYDSSEYAKIVGMKFQAVMIEFDAGRLPYVSLKEGKGIKAPAVYVRREGVTAEANHTELQTIINRRIESGHSTSEEIDLRRHLDELKVLFAEVPRDLYGDFGALTSINSSLQSFYQSLAGTRKANPKFPKEDYEAFVLRMIDAKKRRIEATLGVASSA